ncbi:G5 domain-containing protein [Helcococcus sueciensis]|uniref:G5 domain-containing protein n=1 Tax=Helcococcus sueciensis TaxID=241555 RepID=UPI0004250E60|nr:G5 domain-containing protein [Helcococcus sueciensis]
MIKDSIKTRKILSFLLAFALLVGFIPMNLVQAQATTYTNYAEDEATIKDYNGKERYRQTDLQPGDTNQNLVNTDEKVEKDGFKFQTSNPAADTPSKTQYGYQITIDKKTGQRTYTKVAVTDSGLILVNPGNKPMMGQGDKLTPESPAVTYKPQENTELTSSGRQRNLNYEASNETLEHINNKDNNSTSFGFKDNYTQNNPSIKFFGGSFGISYKVNPWPNENDTLQLIKLNGSHNKTEFVQGQTITTNISVENLDDNARERLVGQVYHPVTGEIVPGAKAFINEMDKVVITMPEGVIDENGNLNKDSIFYKDPNFKGIQSLEVKFFTRPRTADEFTDVAQAPEEEWDKGTYVETGAGTATINHKGQDVVIDKQGIDRYDHYNLIGSFKLNLDDTRYYDQGFIDGNKADTSKHTSSAVKPGEEFKVELYVPEDRNNKDLFPNQKTPDQMEAAKDANQAIGSIDRKFIDKINEGKAEEDKWILKYDEDTLPTTFTVTPPLSAKAGDFVAVPLVYTYTNGSTDTHWFHFVVQESSNNRPEYSAQVAFPSEEQVSPAKLVDDENKLKPTGYYIPEGTEFKDDHGNEWNVSIDEKTGTVTAKPVDPSKFNGGEKLNVPVIAKYSDPNEPDKEIIEKTKAEFVIKERANMTPRYNAKAGRSGDELSSEVILNAEDKYNRKPTKFTLSSDTYKDDKGNTWNVSIDEKTGTVTATVPNAEDGKSINGALLNVPVTAHYFDGEDEVSTKEVEVQFVSYGTNGTFETKETKAIEFETEYKVDNSLAPGTVEVEQEGSLGEEEVTVTHTIVDGEVTKSERSEPTRTKEPVKRIVKVGPAKTDGTHTYTSKKPFEVEVRVNPELKKGEHKVVQKGVEGEEEYTITIENSKVTNTSEPKETKAPVNEIIEVGNADFIGTLETKKTKAVEFETEYVVDNSMEPGTTKVEQEGELGEEETTVTHTIVNGQVTKSEEGETKQTKAPVKRIVKVGPAKTEGTHVYTSKKPFEVEVRVNKELQKGEYKVVQKGVEGEEKYTITIENSVVTKTSAPVETIAPVKEIIEVGDGNFTGTVEYIDKDPIPFETEVLIDPTLAPNQIVEDQKGELGEQEVKTTIKIENGQAVDETRGEVTKTKEPVTRKIRVGSKTDGQYKETETIPFEIEVRKDPTLKKGEWKYAEIDGVQQIGESGLKERTLTIVNSKVTEESEFKTTREPKNAIILVGEDSSTGEVTHVEELPFEYKVEEVDDLKKGEYRIVKPGKVGTKTTTWTIKDSQIDGEPKEVIVPAEDALIQVGKGTNDGTHEIVEKKVLPFETIIEYDDSLEPGEEKVVQEGTPGEQERTNTLVIQDGKVLETKEGEFKTTKEPVNKIVKVGRKSTEGEVTKTIEREIPYETKVIYDENLEAGFQEIENEGKPGKEEVTITQKVKDSKPVGEATETVKTITEKEDRVVRIGVKPVVKEVELGNDTEYRHNPELKAGEEKVIEEGSKGSVKYTTTFNKETGKLEVTEERVEPKNKIVEYGTKTEGEFKYESEQAYDVIIRENPDLDAGTHKVVQEGIVGKTETTVKVVNSEEVSRETKTITEKQDMIIEIGTKNVCEIPPIDPENPDTPETPGEEEPKDPETPGEETPREEEPKDPETPGGETPREEEPKDPEIPGEETPREEEPKNPETPGKETPREEESGKPGKENPNKPGNKKPESNNTSNPRTGDDGVMYIGAVALIAVVVLLYVSKKKNKNEQ